MFRRALASSALFCLLWTSANGGVALSQTVTPVFESAPGTVTPMPGQPPQNIVMCRGTVSITGLANTPQTCTLKFEFFRRTKAVGTVPPGDWGIFRNANDVSATVDPVRKTATAFTSYIQYDPNNLEYCVRVSGESRDPSKQVPDLLPTTTSPFVIP